jgi:hypothetical protein
LAANPQVRFPGADFEVEIVPPVSLPGRLSKAGFRRLYLQLRERVQRLRSEDKRASGS